MTVSKAKITIGLAVSCLILIASLQPFYLGHWYYFGIDARLICMPLAFFVLPFLFIHIYQNRSTLASLYRRARKKEKRALYHFVTTVVMLAIGFTDIISGWVSGLSGSERYLFFPMWVWSWAFTLLIFLHAYQRRKQFWAYLRSFRKYGA